MGTSFERVEFLVDNSNLSWRAPFIKPSVTSLSPLCKILTGNYWVNWESDRGLNSGWDSGIRGERAKQ